MGRRRVKMWCERCFEYTWHKEIEVKDLVADGKQVKGAFTLRCEKSDQHGQQQQAA